MTIILIQKDDGSDKGMIHETPWHMTNIWNRERMLPREAGSLLMELKTFIVGFTNLAITVLEVLFQILMLSRATPKNGCCLRPVALPCLCPPYRFWDSHVRCVIFDWQFGRKHFTAAIYYCLRAIQKSGHFTMANAKHRTTQFVRLRPKTSREIDVRDQKKILAEKLQFAGAFLRH